MKRGSTPIHEFTVDMDLTDAKVIYITYEQGGVLVIEKNIEDIKITPTMLSFRLTQAETLKFNEKGDVEIQIRAKMNDDTAYVSNIMTATVERLLKSGEI